MKELQEVFYLDEDLFRPTEERNIPFKLKIDKIIYLNKEQYHFMMDEHHKERKERYMNSRFLISTKFNTINIFVKLIKQKTIKK